MYNHEFLDIRYHVSVFNFKCSEGVGVFSFNMKSEIKYLCIDMYISVSTKTGSINVFSVLNIYLICY